MAISQFRKEFSKEYKYTVRESLKKETIEMIIELIMSNIKKQILTDCIYGVDKDYNAVEAARFGLLLKLLEDESSETLTKELPVLPELSKNIIFGNSLIEPLLNSKYLEWFSSIYGEVFRGGYIARGTKVLKQLPIRVIDFTNKDDKKLHDNIAETQKSIIRLQGDIDKNIITTNEN